MPAGQFMPLCVVQMVKHMIMNVNSGGEETASKDELSPDLGRVNVSLEDFAKVTDAMLTSTIFYVCEVVYKYR